jgi:hypothetical protein
VVRGRPAREGVAVGLCFVGTAVLHGRGGWSRTAVQRRPEAARTRWAGSSFLNAFGLKLEPEYVGSGGTFEVPSSAHPVFAGVSKLFSAGANPVTNITPGSPARKVFSELVPGKSLLGLFEASLSP